MLSFVSAVRLPSPAFFSYGCKIYHAICAQSGLQQNFANAGSTSHGWKMKRIKLMSLVCAETVRIEAVRMQQLPYVFQRLPLNVHGNLPLSEVGTFSALYTHTQCNV